VLGLPSPLMTPDPTARLKERPLPIKLACIDMAGTTVSDGGIVLQAFSAALEAVGLAGDDFGTAMKYAHDTMGFAKTAVFGRLLGDEVLVDKALTAFDASILEVISQGGVPEIPDAAKTLKALGQGGTQVCLTTGFSAVVQEAIVAQLGWGDLVSLQVAPGPRLRGRPYPDMVLFAALELKVDDVREIAVVGDTSNDLWSGHRAGAAIVAGVLTGSHDRAELEQAPHTHILSSIADLLPLLSPEL
jgi:phosphoglycolate phosphatase